MNMTTLNCCLDTTAFARFLKHSRIKFAFSFTQHGELAQRSYIVKRYRQGRCYAIRYAAGWTLEMICSELVRSLPPVSEWLPFNESTNTFLA